MDSTSTATTLDLDSDWFDRSVIKSLLQRALREYDSKQHWRLRFQWLDNDLPMAQRLNLDFGRDSSQNRRKYLSLLRHLTRRFQILPSSLIINGIKREGQNPVAGGGFADIWRGSLNGKPVCLKVLRLIVEPDENTRAEIREQFCHEALIWRQLKHPNILPLLGVERELFSPSFCLISPWMKNKDIITFLKQNPHHSLSSVLCEVAAGLLYLHSREPPVIHGDIRGGNILVNDDLRCCLADFGLAVVTTSSQAWSHTTSSCTCKGSTRWLAPEYIFNRGSLVPKHTSQDVYAFGCTIIEILTKKLPFCDLRNDAAVISSLNEGGRPSRPESISYPEILWDLTNRCWAQDAHTRPSANEIHSILEGLLGSAIFIKPVSSSLVKMEELTEVDSLRNKRVEFSNDLASEKRFRQVTEDRMRREKEEQEWKKKCDNRNEAVTERYSLLGTLHYIISLLHLYYLCLHFSARTYGFP
ncbi:hypothetical protein GYMLUDRAFT_245426 [Collybiopsis luxurians FD-317 M1]|uniref:Protein kinase domain-containing protein n=1 Tax=Collybiopsis luxurians FD-317 M1 TaxID=944289 RepID=A0A0D0CU56_9AGAR|nr:hypothetical protein GYMLUDRAFT_245426 [Collybiopsis luxurians FD-317 M1]